MIFLCIAFIFVLTIYIIQEKNKYRAMKSIPGPVGLPIIGSIFEFGFNTGESLLNDLKRLMDIYGRNDYVIKINIGPGDMHVLIADPELTEFFLSSPKYLTKSDEYNLLRPWIKNGLLTSTGIYWQKRRKMLTPTFHFKILEQYISILNTGSDMLVERLSKQIGIDNVVDICPFVIAFTLDVICETLTGTSIYAQQDPNNEYAKAVKEICSISVNRTFSWKRSPLLFKLSKDHKIQEQYIKFTNEVTKNIIEKRRKCLVKSDAQISSETINDDDLGVKKKLAFLDLLLNSKIDGEQLSDDDILEEVNTLLFAGHDTSSSIITFALYELARNPEIQNKVYEETKDVFGTNKKYKATLTDLNNLKYLELVIKESLRMYPPAPVIGRQLEEDVTFKDKTFMKGCSLTFFSLYMHHRPDLFENPEKFQPERFLERQFITKNNFSYIPFSAGPRNCIGQKLAMLVVKEVLSKVIRNFEIIKYQDITLSYEVVLKPTNGMPLKLRKRN